MDVGRWLHEQTQAGSTMGHAQDQVIEAIRETIGTGG